MGFFAFEMGILSICHSLTVNAYWKSQLKRTHSPILLFMDILGYFFAWNLHSFNVSGSGLNLKSISSFWKANDPAFEWQMDGYLLMFHRNIFHCIGRKIHLISCKNFTLTLRSFQIFYDAIYWNCLESTAETAQNTRKKQYLGQIEWAM